MNGRPSRIFVVEDEALIAMEIQDRLTNLGYVACGSAARGEEAIAQIMVVKPDLVLMDICLAGEIDGVETATRLRAHVDVPVVFLSAFSDTAQIRRAIGAEPFGYLVKPFEERELLTTIEAALYKHHMERALREANARLEEKVRERTASLAASEARLREAQSIARIGDWVVDLESGAIDWSDVLYQIFGRDSREFHPTLQSYYAEIVHPGDVPEVRRIQEAILATQQGRGIDHRFLRPDGSEGWIQLEGIAVWDDAGRPIQMVGTAQDITERKCAEIALGQLNETLEQRVAERTAALVESEAFNRATLDALNAHVAVLDCRGIIIATNAAWRTFANTNGVNWQEVSEQSNYLDVCDRATGECADEAHLVAAGIRDVIAGRLPEFALEYPCHSPDEERWFVCKITRFQQAGPLRVVVTHENISALKLAELAVRSNKARLVRSQQMARLGHWTWRPDCVRGPWHTGLSYSQTAADIFGVTPHELAVSDTEYLARFVHPDDRPAMSQIYGDERPPPPHDRPIEYRIVRPDGSIRHLVEIIAEIKAEGKAPAQIQGMIQDVTDLARLQRHLAQAQHIGRLGSWEMDIDGGQLFWSEETYRIFGLEPSSISPSVDVLRAMIHPDDSARNSLSIIQRIARNERYEEQIRIIRDDGEERWLYEIGEPVGGYAGSSRRFAGIVMDITERKRIELAMQALSLELVSLEGVAYFEAAAAKVAMLLNISHAFIARLDPNRPSELQTVAWIEDGIRLPTINLATYDMPFGEIVAGHSVLIAGGLQQRYPAATFLVQLRAEACAAEPIYDHAGRVVGCLGVINRRRLKDTATVETILRMFSVAVAAAMAREQIHRRDTWLRAIFENTLTEIVLKDRDLRIMAASRNVTEELGSTMSNAVGKSARDFFPPEIAAIYEAADRKVIESGLPVQQEVKEMYGGNIRYINNVKFPLRDDSGGIIGIGSFSTEVTANKRIELAMLALSSELIALEGSAYYEASARELTALLGVECVFITRSRSGGLDELDTVAVIEDNVLLPNILYSTIGTPSADVIAGRSLVIERDVQYYYPHDADLANKRIEGYAGESLRDSAGRLLGHVVVMSRRPFRDSSIIATTLKMFAVGIGATMARERARRQFEDLFEFAPSGLVMVDRQGRIALANRQIEEMFGWTREELVGRPVETLVPPSLRGLHTAFREKFLQSGARRQMGATRRVLHGLRKNGSEFPAEIDLAPVEFEDDVMIAASVRDITSRLALEERLAHAQKMEAIGNLTGGMAHDFNNYLGVIIGSLDLLKEMSANDPRAGKFIDTALRGALRSADLTQSLLAFARRQPLVPRVIDVGRCILDTAKLIERTIGEDVTIDLTVAPDLSPALIDEGQLASCIMNLARNARDAMPKGGELTMSARNIYIDDFHEALNLDIAAGDYILIDISDTGIGMAPDILASAFEPFFTTKGIGHGTGLGLSMAYGFVKQSGGQIKISSEPGRGTIVSLYLPRARENGPGTSTESAGSSLTQAGSEIVLLVEDNEVVRLTVAAQLASLGYRVIEAENGDVAAPILVRHEEHIDLLITDIVMPGELDGYALARLARDHRPDLRVLLTSGYVGGQLHAKDVATLGLTLLSKPYRKDELARVIREVLDADASGPRLH